MKRSLFLVMMSCATLDPATLTAPCRVAYDTCLNGCPSGDSRALRPQAQQGQQQRRGSTRPLVDDEQQQYEEAEASRKQLADCTQRCNDRARECQR